MFYNRQNVGTRLDLSVLLLENANPKLEVPQKRKLPVLARGISSFRRNWKLPDKTQQTRSWKFLRKLPVLADSVIPMHVISSVSEKSRGSLHDILCLQKQINKRLLTCGIINIKTEGKKKTVVGHLSLRPVEMLVPYPLYCQLEQFIRLRA